MSEFTDLQEEVEKLQNQSVQDLHNATSILTRAQQLYNDTSQVTIQELQGEYVYTVSVVFICIELILWLQKYIPNRLAE